MDHLCEEYDRVRIIYVMNVKKTVVSWSTFTVRVYFVRVNTPELRDKRPGFHAGVTSEQTEPETSTHTGWTG